MRPKFLAILLSLGLSGSVLAGMRCLSATAASCSPATLFGGGPALDVPYAGTRPEAVAAMLDLAGVGAGDRVIDLGTGDGRILLAAAERGASGLGVDIDPVLVARAQAAAQAAGVADRAAFRTQDLFATPIADADVLTMFLLPEVNLRLRPRILAGTRPGTRIVSHSFRMGDWPPDATARSGGSRLYLWIVPARVAGDWRVTGGAGGEATLRLWQRYQQAGGALIRDGTSLPLSQVALTGDRLTYAVAGEKPARRYRWQIQGGVMIGAAPAPDARNLRAVAVRQPAQNLRQNES